MFSLFTNSASRSAHRRDLLKAGGLGLLGLSPLQSRIALANETELGRATAKRCIFIFLCGGPSQLEMWDPKPDAPEQVRGPFGAVETSAPGVRFGGLIPEVAKHADKLAVIRSMTHGSNSHDIGILYTLLADSKPPTQRAYPPTREDHPGLGAILRAVLGEHPELPSWVIAPRPFTTGARYYKGQTAGLLGPSKDPFTLDLEKKHSLGDKDFDLTSLKLLDGIDRSRLRGRSGLLEQINDARPIKSASVEQLEQYYNKAYSMLASSGASRAFDVTREPNSVRDRYGRNEYGQSFLLARRLSEAGVRMVNVFWTLYGEDGCQFNLWDNHGSDKKVCGGFNKGVDMLTAPYCCPAFDRAFSALLDDLHQRGMLDDTLVVVTGEFGRTPKMNKNAGRDHWSPCYSIALAGGGVQGGQVYGASDRQAAYVQESPVRPEDVGATVLHAFGLAPETAVYDLSNRPVRASKGQPITDLFG
ncbi:MAG: DUF1501 domain-containing protein [Pirellulaceae bacterium]|jgi:hypothetical protein|nr:DUF1501 domain-containing protein [Pirellulaceae bacterium]